MHFALVIVVILIIALYLSEYDHKQVVCGTWVADDKFCADNGINAVVLTIDKCCSSGKLVVKVGDTSPINSEFKLSGWPYYHMRRPHFSQNLVFKFLDHDGVAVPGLSMTQKMRVSHSKDGILYITLPTALKIKKRVPLHRFAGVLTA
jgi:hypothetical protein